MPTFSTFIRGNLPVEIEIDEEGDFMEATVETKSGTVYLDLDANEIESVMSKNVGIIHDSLDEFRRNRDDWHRSIADDMRRKS